MLLNMKIYITWVISRVHNEREYATPVYGAMPSVPRFDVTNQRPRAMNIIIRPRLEVKGAVDDRVIDDAV